MEVEEAGNGQLLEQDSSIRCIDQESIHKICSGQVVTCLADVLKELIENSLDAGAKLISIRLFLSFLLSIFLSLSVLPSTSLLQNLILA